METTDAAVWTRVRSGDEAALGELFDLHGGRLFRHAARVLTQREDAKDAVVIAFAEAWRKRGSVRVVEGSPLPWLLATVSNVALNLERSARRYRRLLARVPVQDDVAPAEGGDESGVVAALKRLPVPQRDVVVLTLIEGFAHDEAARALGVPVGTVKSRLSRAKARLRAELIEGGIRWTT